MTVHNDASAPATPGEGHRTGTGGPDALRGSQGLDAAIEAAQHPRDKTGRYEQ